MDDVGINTGTNASNSTRQTSNTHPASATGQAARLRPEQAAHMFLTPRTPQQVQVLTLEASEMLHIDTPEAQIAVLSAGTGPAVLLLHGWEGQAADMASFATALLAAGYRVLVMDLPAHGASGGQQSSIPQAARALLAVGAAQGPLHAAIAHSVGSAVLAEALYAGLAAERAVFIAAPAHYADYARAFAAALGLDADGTASMLAVLREQMGVDVQQVSLPLRAPYLKQPALFMHSADDRVVPIADSIGSAAAWPGAQHIRVEGLGHKRILADKDVVGIALDFISVTAAVTTNTETEGHTSHHTPSRIPISMHQPANPTNCEESR